jgi:hypothetical protein
LVEKDTVYVKKKGDVWVILYPTEGYLGPPAPAHTEANSTFPTLQEAADWANRYYKKVSLWKKD